MMQPSGAQESLEQYPGREQFFLIDTHCHLDSECFKSDRNHIIETAESAGLRAIIIPSISASNWPSVGMAAERYTCAYPNYGLHPLYLQQHQPEDLDLLAATISHDTTTVGIGEIGLDYSDASLDRLTQIHYFSEQLQIAQTCSLPVIVHARKAVEDVIIAIKASGHRSGMLHSYNGSYEQAKRLMDLGFYFSFGGAVTHQRATRLRKLVSQLPLEKLLLETDAPYQPDAELGPAARNEPSRLTKIFQSVCSLRSETPAQIAAATTANAIRLFNLPLK